MSQIIIKYSGLIGSLYCSGCTITIREGNDASSKEWVELNRPSMPTQHKPSCARAIELTKQAYNFK